MQTRTDGGLCPHRHPVVQHLASLTHVSFTRASLPLRTLVT